MARGNSRAQSESPKGAKTLGVEKTLASVPIIGAGGRVNVERLVATAQDFRDMAAESNPEGSEDWMESFALTHGSDLAKTAAGIITDSLEHAYLVQAKEAYLKSAKDFEPEEVELGARQYDKMIAEAKKSIESSMAEVLASPKAENEDGDGFVTGKDRAAEIKDMVTYFKEQWAMNDDRGSETVSQFASTNIKKAFNDVYESLTKGLSSRTSSRAGSELAIPPPPPVPRRQTKAPGSSINFSRSADDPYRRSPDTQVPLRDGSPERRPTAGEMRDGPNPYRYPRDYKPGQI
jgi:hypothetical protein